MTTAAGAARELYLDLIKRILTNTIYQDPPIPAPWAPEDRYDALNRELGIDWPSVAHTMVGRRRLDNVQHCMEVVLAEDVPGDFVETGVWRGGTCILMRAVLAAHGVTDRRVWAADSFCGMPAAGAAALPADRELATDRYNEVIAVDLATVRDNFSRYGLLDDQVRFLAGWFAETLPRAPVERLALLRLDSDLYESTTQSLVELYPRLSPGGFVIVDDFHIEVCRQAVQDWRAAAGVSDPIEDIDGLGVYWRRA